jgi:ketosteroid isomerase-like protein
MQSLQFLARKASLDRDLMASRVQDINDRLVARDLPGLLALFSDDVVFELIGNWSIFPNAGRAQGKEAWARALATVYTELQNLGSTVHEVVIDGDCVALRRTTRLRNYGTGRVGDVEIADFLRFRDGLIVEITEIVDSLAVARLEEG